MHWGVVKYRSAGIQQEMASTLAAMRRLLCPIANLTAVQNRLPGWRQKRLAVSSDGPIIPTQPAEGLILLGHGGFGDVVQTFDGLVETEDSVNGAGDGAGVEAGVVHADAAVAGDAAAFKVMGGGPFGIDVDGGDARGHKVGLDGAGLVGVQELQKGKRGDKLGEAFLGMVAVAVAVGCKR